MTRSKTHLNRAAFSATPALTAGLLTAGTLAALASTDYGPAVWRPACSGHWSTTGYGHKFLVIHDMEGYYAFNVADYLQRCSTTVSIHYAVNGKKDATSDMAAGEVTQMVRESYYAWHALCWNGHSAGTEHEGFVSNPAWFTDEMYNSSAALQRHLCAVYGVPKDRNHIVGHNAKSSSAWVSWANANLGINATCNTHSDPGSYWDWTKFMNLINQSTPPPAAVFMRPTYTSSGTSPSPTTANNADGRLEIIGLGTNSALWHMYETANNGPWSSWESFGGQYQQTVAGRHNDKRIEIFGIGTDNSVSSIYQQNNQWNGPAGFGGSMTSLSVGNNLDGRIELFGTGTDGALWHLAEGPNNGPWSAWMRFGETGVTKVAVGRHNDGRMEAFYLGPNGVAGAYYQTSPNAGWAKSTTIPGNATMKALAVANNADGRLEIAGVGTDGALWHMYETANNGPWSSWEKFGESGLTHVVIWPHVGNRLEIFYLGANGMIGGYFQTAATGGSWAKSTNFPVVALTSLAVGSHNDGRIELFGRGTDGTMRFLFESSPNGPWAGSWGTWGGVSFK